MNRLLITMTFFLCVLISHAQVTYKDVAGIFFSRCTSCHHEGGAGPFSLMTYSETSQQTIDIFDALTSGTMPPWSPDTTYTRFLHERIITEGEKTAILDWINLGAPPGDTTLAPPPPVYSGYQLNGTPTMVLQIPTFTSNAVSEDSYVCFSLPSNLAQDQYLRAFEVVPGNSAIVHHVILSVDTLGTTVDDLSGTCYTIPGDFGLGGFAPGAPPTVFPGQAPMKTGILIKAGSRIVLQMHYPAGSAGLVDSTKVRFYFYPVNETGIRPVTVFTPLQNWSLILPPDSVTSYNASFPALPVDISMLATFPHSHLICSSITNYALSGNDTIPLIRINNWDFEWQGYYNYRFPVKVPAGYSLEGIHEYDNTINNPNNPNSPPQVVFAGLSTTDEMFFDSFQLTYYLPGDELIDIEAILETDSLFSGISAPQLTNVPGMHVTVFPNPSSGEFTFNIDGAIGKIEIEIYSVLGKLIDKYATDCMNSQCRIKIWGRSNSNTKIPSAGIYTYTVKNGSNLTSGKITLLHK